MRNVSLAFYIFENSVDPDEMQHDAAFYQVYNVCKGIKDHHSEEYKQLEKYNLTPLDVYSRLSQVNCTKNY